MRALLSSFASFIFVCLYLSAAWQCPFAVEKPQNTSSSSSLQRLGYLRDQLLHGNAPPVNCSSGLGPFSDLPGIGRFTGMPIDEDDPRWGDDLQHQGDLAPIRVAYKGQNGNGCAIVCPPRPYVIEFVTLMCVGVLFFGVFMLAKLSFLLEWATRPEVEGAGGEADWHFRIVYVFLRRAKLVQSTYKDRFGPGGMW